MKAAVCAGECGQKKEEMPAARQNGSARSRLGQNEGKGDCRI